MTVRRLRRAIWIASGMVVIGLIAMLAWMLMLRGVAPQDSSNEAFQPPDIVSSQPASGPSATQGAQASPPLASESGDAGRVNPPAATQPGSADARSGRRPALRARVDPRIELMSIIFRLAGNPEYNMACSNSPYAYDVDKHFGRFVHHPVIDKARELRAARGIAFDAVTSIAVHINDAVELTERVPFDTSPPRLDPRWKPNEAREFLKLARDFVNETEFAHFLEMHRPLYTAASIRMNEVLRRYDIRRWLDGYFGVEPEADYSVIVGLLTGGGNYGMSVQYPDGREEITPVIGCAHFDEHGIPVIDDAAWLPIIVHEFCHPYSNPLFDKNPEPFHRSGQALFERNSQAMRSQAYGGWQSVVCETLVRASVVRYLETNHGSKVAQAEMDEQLGRSWKWLPAVCEKLKEYEQHRDRYATFEDFLPEIAAAMDAYVAGM